MSGVGELVGGAFLGAAVGELFQLIKAAIIKVAIFKTQLKQLESTLESVTPIVHQIDKLNRDLDQQHETKRLKEILDQGKQLVGKCLTMEQWNLWKRYRYATKLQELDGSILRFFQLDMQAQNTRDGKILLVGMEDVKRVGTETQVEVKEIKELLLQRLKSENGSIGPCSVPAPPNYILGLDDPLKKIKKDLFKKGTQVIVVSAAGGSGKTTLVRKLCQDDQVKDKFKRNIFYVTVSETHNVKLIVQNIYEHKGQRVPQFQTNEEAISKLELLLKAMESEAILLVLDDVWSGSESMLQDFKFELSDYKILVTSRYKFPQFGSGHNLEPLNEEDAIKLFRHSAILPDENSYKPNDNILNEIVKACKRSPLVLTVVGKSLRGRPAEVWRKRAKDLAQDETIFHSNNDILIRLRSSLDVLDDEVKQCFLDLGSFPEDQRIPATALVDMWSELYKLDEDLDVIFNLGELSDQSLLNLVRPRNSDDVSYNGYFVTQHDLLRELIIHQNKLEPVEKRERINIEIKGNNFDEWWLEQKQNPLKARLMSISTDEKFSSTWFNLDAPEVEVVVLNIRSKKYTLPNFMEKMNKMKVLMGTNYGFFPAELSNFQLLGSLPNLKRIRLEHVSIPSFDMTTMQMKDLQKISLVRCNIGKVFRNSTFRISYTCPNLKEIDIDYCIDLNELPEGLCEIVSIRKLSITNCHKLSTLPKGIGKLVNLQVLRVASCTDLEELPHTIGDLSNLNFLDLSECLSIKELPIQVGRLRSLKTLCMKGCSSCKLPRSITNLKQLEVVRCDEETAYNWNDLVSDLSNLRVEKLEEDTNAFVQSLTGL